MKNDRLISIINGHIEAAIIQVNQQKDPDRNYSFGMLDGLMAVREDIKETLKIAREIKTIRKIAQSKK